MVSIGFYQLIVFICVPLVVKSAHVHIETPPKSSKMYVEIRLFTERMYGVQVNTVPMQLTTKMSLVLKRLL